MTNNFLSVPGSRVSVGGMSEEWNKSYLLYLVCAFICFLVHSLITYILGVFLKVSIRVTCLHWILSVGCCKCL